MTGNPTGLRSGPGRWVARHPLFATSIAVTAAVALVDLHPLAGGTAITLCIAAAGRWVGWKAALIGWTCAFLAAAVFLIRSQARDEAGRALIGSPHGAARAVLLKDPQGNARHWSGPARLIGGLAPGAKVWWEGSGETPVAGSVVAAEGIFEALPKPRNPGEFDRGAWLRRQGTAAMFRADWKPAAVSTGPWAARGAAIRHGFRNRVTDGLDPRSEAAAVIRAVVIGEQPPDADALIAAFRNSGTLHAFSVSGLHVAMVGSIGWLFLSWLGVPRRWAVVALLPLIFGYSWITGNSAPAVRSAWMAAVFLGAFVFRRKPDLLNALGAVLLAAMLWDGRLLFQPGVQLSYGVVAAIAIGTAWAARVFSWMAETDPFLPESMMGRWQTRLLDLRRRICQSLAVSLAAAIGSAPLTILHFGLVTPISILAGLVLLPLVFVLLTAALVSVALSPVLPPAARAMNRANGFVADLSVRSAEFFSSIPGGHFQTRSESRPMLIVYDLDYGAGAACFSAGKKGAVLIDCGDRLSFRQRVTPSLRSLGIEPDSVVLTHPDGNHLGGGSPVWQAFPIRQALLPVELARSPSHRQWLRDAPAAGIRTLQAAQTTSLAFPDDATLEVLHAPDPTAVNTLADDRVALYRLRWRGWRILFTSDAGMGTELRLLDQGRDLSADLIIAGRHRGDLTLCDRFLDAVQPMAIIASNPPYPASERIPADAAAYWKSRGIHLIDQAATGGVTLTLDPRGLLVIQGYLTKEPLILHPR